MLDADEFELLISTSHLASAIILTPQSAALVWCLLILFYVSIFMILLKCLCALNAVNYALIRRLSNLDVLLTLYNVSITQMS